MGHTGDVKVRKGWDLIYGWFSLVVFCLLTLERKRKGGGRREKEKRQKHQFVVPFNYAFIG